MRKIGILKIVLIIWYLFCFFVFISHRSLAYAVLIILTAIMEWLWKGPLKKHGITWTVKK